MTAVCQSRQLVAALRYHALGLSFCPVLSDGSKAAACKWAPFQTKAPDERQARNWFAANDRNGIAIIGGKASGNLLVLDFESIELFDAWSATARPLLESEEIWWESVPIVETPRPGRHVYLRCTGHVPGNDKLAMDRDGKTTLIETRGEGGYVLAPGSPAACHPTGREYKFIQQGWVDGKAAVRPAGPELLEMLLGIARALDRTPDRRETTQWETNGSHDGQRPGDMFNRRADWREILSQAGGTLVSEAGGIQNWRRPGKESGISATVGVRKTAAGVSLLIVHSTNWHPFQATTKSNPKGYTPFEAFTLLNHRGDFSEAARALMPRIPTPHTNGIGKAHRERTATAPAAEPDKPQFKMPVPISQLVKPPKQSWLWEGFNKLDGISLLSALWKVGKTTLLSRLLLAYGAGGEFLGLSIEKANVLYISEENDGEWVERRDKLRIGDHVHILSQPWDYKPSIGDWFVWLDFLKDYCEGNNIGFVCFDTVSMVWPIQNENDASEVNTVLMPMRKLAKGRSIDIVHHLAKFDRGDGTGTRGSGALCGFCDVVTEMRRYKQGDDVDDDDDRRRVLTSVSRWDETPRKLVIRLRDDGTDFDAEGDGQEVREAKLVAELLKILPSSEPGITVDDAREALPESVRPKRAKVVQALQSGAATGQWEASGTGRRGDPRRFWNPKNSFLSFPFPDPGKETENRA